MRFRLAYPSDAQLIVEMIQRDGGFRPDPAIERDLPGLVAELIHRCPTQWVIWEDTTAAPAIPVACGGSAFVEAEHLSSWLAQGHPYPANRLLRGLHAGTARPLDTDAIRAGNRGPGLELLVFPFVLVHRELSHPVTQRFLPVGNAAGYFAHSGYRINSITFEVYGAEHEAFMIAGGYRLWNDYAGNPLAQACAPELRPALYGMRRDDVTSGAMNQMMLAVFNPQSPLLALSPAEQRIAIRALLGETDLEIAAALGLSAETVRKRWTDIFTRAQLHLPSLFVGESVAGRRGDREAPPAAGAPAAAHGGTAAVVSGTPDHVEAGHAL